MKFLRDGVAFLLLFAALAHAGTVTGSVQQSNGQTLNNGTFAFSLSQGSIISGTANLATNTVNCYTSNAGQVTGLPDPQVLPVASYNAASGTLAVGTYFVKLSYYTGTGETLVSPEVSFTTGGSGTLVVTAPVLQPSSATGYRVYISTSSGTETLQSSVNGFGNYSQSVPLISGLAAPSTNTTSCSLRFNDELIPSYTSYTVNLTSKSGAQIAGYPQRWYLSGGTGGTINISSGTPIFNGVVVFPSAIVSIPNLNTSQSISGPLTLNTYAFSAGQGQFYNPLSVSQQYHLRFGIDSSDSGGYFESSGANAAAFSAGAAFNGANWTGKNATASILEQTAGAINFYSDSSLTVGNTFTPTKRFAISSQGNPALVMPFVPQGYMDWTNSGACSNLSVANHGVICYDQGANTFKFSVNGGAFGVINGGGAAGYNEVDQNGVQVAPARSKLNFITSTNAINCVDNAGATRTDCSVFQASSTIGSGSSFTLTVNTGEGATGSNPSLEFANPGALNLRAGQPSNNADGDQIQLIAGNGQGSGHLGGNASVLAGGGGTGAGTGGNVIIQSGTGGGTGAGGAVGITAGASGATSGAGGSITLTAGNSTTSGNGGDVLFVPGLKAGAGSNGRIAFTGSTTDPSSGLPFQLSCAYNTTSNRMKCSENNDARGYFNVTGQSVFAAFCSGTATASATLFPWGAGGSLLTCTDTTANLSIPMPSAGILRNLNVKAGTAGVNGSSGVVTIKNNGGATALTCTIGTGTTCSDTTHTATVAAGDLVSIQFTTQGGETLANLRVSFEKQ